MLQSKHQLNQEELNDLDLLKAACKKEDGGVPNLYYHVLSKQRNFPASLLYYVKQQLVGFLSIYFFYDDAVEVSLLVHPSNRRNGIAKKLIASILPLVQSQNNHYLIFTSPAHLNDNWLSKKGFTYLHSEYYMERTNLNPLLGYEKQITFRKATKKDIPLLCAIDEAAFPKKQERLAEHLNILLNDNEYLLILALKENHPIGKAHIHWKKNGMSLSDIAILPSEQGKGLGSALIAHCINLALSEGKSKIDLDVETHNQKALDLYTRLGFTIKNACDYWKISVEQISK